jgi:YfiR/HmsC-like
MRRRLEPDTMTGPSLGQLAASARPGRRAPCRLVVGAALAVTLLMPLVGGAQDVTAPALKAAFVYNFVRFTEWPSPLPASEPFVLCVLGDDAVGDALARVVEGREVAGRRMTVLLVAASASKDSCRVLYVSGTKTTEVVRVVAGLRDAPVLTISDDVGFTDAGGMAQLFFERGQLRFSIKVETVKRARLQMSSRLLVLARK